MLALYGFLFLLVSLQPPPGWEKVFAGLALVYWTGFFGVVTGYFWARWYALGLGLSGLMSAGISIFQMGPEPVLVFYGGTHALIAGMLWGNQMAKPFDGRIEWRKRFHLDEQATDKLGKAITRVGMSLPYVIMYALSPKTGGAELLGIAGLGFALLGGFGLIRKKTWGVFGLGFAAVSALSMTLIYQFSNPSVDVFSAVLFGETNNGHIVFVSASIAAALLLGAIAPFANSIVRALRPQ